MTSVLVRHASAGDPSGRDADDRLRPLDPRGFRQAAALGDLLRTLPVERVVSSPYLRCIQTVEPLAAACGLVVEHDDRLAEGAGAAARDLLAGAGVVACTHGDVVESLLGHGLKKGAAVLLQDGRVVGEIQPPTS
jgi:broad specificity phosphatase PhoE